MSCESCLTGGHSVACVGKHTNPNVHFSVREKWDSHVRPPQPAWAVFRVAGWYNLYLVFPQTGLDRGSPCHVSTFATVFTSYGAAHLCFVPAHQGNLLSLCGNNVNLPLRKTTPDLYRTNCRSVLPSFPPSLSLLLPPFSLSLQPPYHL